ncbi:sigma factor [Nonomuraea roseola]|uniref:Sigma factor n=1 Tax=Nonomuraea roseola TaxID=46179 RepID=A0ABV5QG94_9ACTN
MARAKPWEVSDELWAMIEPLPPQRQRLRQGIGIADMSVSDLYGELRPRAFAIAYQMLGSVSEAEHVVQEAFLRMHQTLQRDERSPRRGRTSPHWPPGTWWPEPATTSKSTGPATTPHGDNAKNWPSASSPPPNKAT